MKNKGFVIALALVVVFGLVFFGLSRSIRKEASPSASSAGAPTLGEEAAFRVVPADPKLLIKSHSPVKGEFSAKVTVVEFLDPECEACGAMYPIVKQLLKEHEKDVKFVVRYMPYHQNSKYVANILEGARAQGKYWEALELLFATQNQWADHHQPKPEIIPEILKDLKLDMQKILTDAQAGKYDSLVLEDQEDGKKLAVRGTPTFFVNGHQIQELGYEALKNAIVDKLEK